MTSPSTMSREDKCVRCTGKEPIGGGSSLSGTASTKTVEPQVQAFTFVG